MTEDKPARPAPEQKWPRKVRTTMEPDRVREVGPAEYADLTAWGVIKSEEK